jgi:NAD(P)-dependent dehydrogenase (short-subunit alcohol dehydrogenase family)
MRNYIVWRLGFRQSSYSPYRAGPPSASFHTPGHDRWFSGHACLVTFTFQIQLLVNNAGVMALPERTTTPQRWETQFATNHLGHAALTLGLHDALAAAQGARIVVVSSSAHLMSPVVFYDIHFTFRPYDAWSAYGQSKTAAILFTVATAKKWAAAWTSPQAGKPRSRGAATSVLLAASPHVHGATGRYFEDSNEAIVLTEPRGGMSGVAPYALDPNDADRLWDETARLLQR